jgi:hypothetical protein
MTIVAKKPTPEEEQAIKQRSEDDAVKAALEAVAVQKKQAEMNPQLHSAPSYSPNYTAPPGPAPRPVNVDIPVTALKTESYCRMGSRSYALKKGNEIMMDPNHAAELSAGPDPWVAPVRVFSSHP